MDVVIISDGFLFCFLIDFENHDFDYLKSFHRSIFYLNLQLSKYKRFNEPLY